MSIVTNTVEERRMLKRNITLVQHGCEIPYVFGGTPNGPAATILSQNVMDYWISFANSLDPNDSFGNTSRESLVLQRLKKQPDE